MKFSFVLPAYKGQYLRESIDSILSQDYTDFELTIVDDCSPDHIDEIVAEYNDPRIAYYRNKENIGGKDLVAQWNHCLTFAKGDYVILATDDDLYEPNFLSTFVPLIEKYPDVNLFRARILQVDCNNNIKSIDRCYKEFLNEIEFRYYMMHGIRGGIPHYIFKRKVLVDNGGFVNFPVAWGSDDATAMMMAKNSKWLLNNEPTMTPPKDWILFFIRNVNEYLPIHIKHLLIIRLSAIPLTKWILAIKILFHSKLLPFKDNCSVIFHSIKKKSFKI